MYGTRDAAASWEATYTNALMKQGWTPGLSSPCMCSHPPGARLVVRGEGVKSLGAETELAAAHKMMEQ